MTHLFVDEKTQRWAAEIPTFLQLLMATDRGDHREPSWSDRLS